jgi:hypothetical protein
MVSDLFKTEEEVKKELKETKPEMFKETEQKTKVNNLFKTPNEVLPRRKLKIAIAGEYETGKSHFVLTCPPPIYVIDTEYGIPPLLPKFKNKEIYVCEAVVEEYDDEGNLRINPIKSLEKVVKAVDSLKNVNEGTIAIDNVSDVWFWEECRMKEMIEEKARKMCQFDWRIANEHYTELLTKCISRETVFVATGRTRPVYMGTEFTGIYEPRWSEKTPYLVDVVIWLEKRRTVESAKPIRYIAKITKCRSERMFDKEIEDITYDKLVEVLKPYLWF